MPPRYLNEAAHKAARRDGKRRRDLLRKYGISWDDYQAMIEAQSGVCAICGLPPDKGKQLQVDHDHESHQVRGLLCHNCNVMLGHAGDSQAVLLRAALYLEENSD